MDQIENWPGFVFTKEDTVSSGILDELRGLLGGLQWAYVARLEQARIVKCTPDLPTDWTEGRAFGIFETNKESSSRDIEVRWKKVNTDRYRLDVLGEDLSAMPSDNGWQPLAEKIDGVRKRRILLWGELTGAPAQPIDWREVRIPHPLQYPFLPNPDPNKPRVAVDSWDYLIGCVVVATRWTRLYQSKPREED